MHTQTLLALLLATTPLTAAETVLGAYIFARHGDRTPKSTPPTNLTSLGYRQVYTSGEYYRSRYLSPSSPQHIRGINQNVVKLSQLSVTAPVDNVLQSSAMGFMQAMYPPVGSDLSTQALANGSRLDAPMNGYQLIPVNTVDSGVGSEDNGWLQDATGCANAKISSNGYFTSAEYNDLSGRTKGFYDRLNPVVNATFTADQVNYKNAYIVYDLINVATIHNTSIPSSSLLDDTILFQLRTLADTHEWGLAYNASSTARSIPGMQLAGEILAYFNNTIAAKGSKSQLGIQFGAYASFLAFFGLAGLDKTNPDFRGVPDYASSMAFELYADADNVAAFPQQSDLRVRFLFANGTASNSSRPQVFPLFGGSALNVSWSDFSNGLNAFAVHTTEQWCKTCGNTTGSCAPFAAEINGGSGSGNGNNGGSGQGSQQNNGGGRSMSAAIGGVIGAMVTLAVILGVQALILLIGGLRVVRKGRLAHGGGASPVSETAKA